MASPVTAARVPPAPPGFDADAWFAGIDWFQGWEIFRGVRTPGSNPIDELCGELGLPADLSGKRVLDIGTCNGCLSFECERRGAREVVALDLDEQSRRGFERIRALVGSTRVHYRVGSAYRLDPDEIGIFDVVLFCGVLYHLRYPLLAVDNIRRVCRGEVFVESFVIDAAYVGMPEERGWRIGRRQPTTLAAVPLWQFFRLRELGDDASNWFGPTSEAIVQAFDSAGFATERRGYRGVSRTRAVFRAAVRPGLAEFLGIGASEGEFYDVAIAHLFGGRRGDFITGTTIEQALVDALVRAGEHADAGAAAATVRSAPFRSGVIAEYYMAFLGRRPAPAEVDDWLRRLERGATHEEVIIGFVASEEYFASLDRSAPRWVDRVHRDLLGDAGAGVAGPINGADCSARLFACSRLVWSQECREHLLRSLYARCLAADSAAR
jgi:tRNA (mo5U34)-methyltransferase